MKLSEMDPVRIEAQRLFEAGKSKREALWTSRTEDEEMARRRHTDVMEARRVLEGKKDELRGLKAEVRTERY